MPADYFSLMEQATREAKIKLITLMSSLIPPILTYIALTRYSHIFVELNPSYHTIFNQSLIPFLLFSSALKIFIYLILFEYVKNPYAILSRFAYSGLVIADLLNDTYQLLSLWW